MVNIFNKFADLISCHLFNKPIRSVLVGLIAGLGINPQLSDQLYCTAELHFRELRTLAPITYLSSDCIATLYIHKWCSFWCSFTSRFPICDLLTISAVTVTKCWKLGVFRSDATNSHGIANWRMGGNRLLKTE
jgi:hypothetical protein